MTESAPTASSFPLGACAVTSILRSLNTARIRASASTGSEKTTKTARFGWVCAHARRETAGRVAAAPAIRRKRRRGAFKTPPRQSEKILGRAPADAFEDAEPRCRGE